LDLFLEMPKWTEPALFGAGAGAIALAIIGFNWGGWVTGGTVSKISEKSSILAVGEALTPYCVAASKADPLSADVMAKLATASSYQKRAIIENAGWATPLGADKPNRALAESCLLSLDSKT
jgi:hypothetical protein